MKAFIVLGLALLASLILVGSLYSPMESQKKPKKESVETIRAKSAAEIDFTLKDMAGNDLTLSDLTAANKTVLINFWAHWCPPCIAELPELIELREKYKDQGFEILGIVSPARMNKDAIRKISAEAGIPYPVLWGDFRTIAKFGNFGVLPTSFVIDRNGKIVDKKGGKGTLEEFEAMIKPHLP